LHTFIISSSFEEFVVSAETAIILLIEDNESHALLAIRGLSKFSDKHRVVHVEDGEAALEYLFRRGIYSDFKISPRPQLILLDLRLPKIDGLEVLKQIKENEDLRSIPTVVLTSSMAEPDIIRAYYYFANSYMVKPLDFSEFRNQMVEIATYWLKWNIGPLL
jgi:two-component system, response regulator